MGGRLISWVKQSPLGTNMITEKQIMNLPYVIDNRTSRLGEVINQLLGDADIQGLDVATAYFNIHGFDIIKREMKEINSFRMLLGSEPQSGAELGLRIRRDLNREPFNEDVLLLVGDLIQYLKQDTVRVRLFDRGFLHAKGYLFFADEAPFDRFIPVCGIVGSSNFTKGGLELNQELNLTHKTIISDEELDDPEAREAVKPLLPAPADIQDPSARKQIKSEVGSRAILELLRWYDGVWAEAKEYKQDLIDLLDRSKFGEYEYSPYEIYLKALFEYFQQDLEDEETVLPGTRSAVELTRFQEDAVRKARRILRRYDGIMIADSVGLGKTWIGKKLLEDYAYHQRMKALVVCPASLRDMWQEELREATIPHIIISQEMMGREEFEIRRYTDVDVVLVDESHNFRNHLTNRYETLDLIINANGGKGRNGQRKKVILLTATPIKNNIFDLYNQLMLIAQNDRGYFSAAGIGDLRRYFLEARQQDEIEETQALFNLLEEVVIRRTRPYIRETYPEVTINDKPIKWPERKLKTIRYDLESAYNGIYTNAVQGIERLQLAPYDLEAYKKTGVDRDEEILERGHALVGIFKSRYLKRFESSVEAFRISVRRALNFQRLFESFIDQGKVLDSTSFRKVLVYLEGEEEGSGSIENPGDMKEEDELRQIFSKLDVLDTEDYALDLLKKALHQDQEILHNILTEIETITPQRDAKLNKVKDILRYRLRDEKVLVFSYYKDTARYLYQNLVEDEAFLEDAGNPNIARLDGDIPPDRRVKTVARFAPKANEREEFSGSDEEIQVLVSTDVLSEGQNLQDCGFLINYDLHWNPTRMIQRAGRIDRIGSDFDKLWVYNVFPEEGLERLLGLVESLSTKISTIDKAGMLESSVLGELVHPKNFNTLQRIADEDESVFEEQERQANLISSEFLLSALKSALEDGEYDVDQLPDGIHSGLERKGFRGLFFYFTAPENEEGEKRHFWRYYDHQTGQIMDNVLRIARLIQCQADEERVIGDLDVFEIQEYVIKDIMGSVKTQRAAEAAPRKVSDTQITIRTLLSQNRNNPNVEGRAITQAIKNLKQPLPRAYQKRLQDAFKNYQSSQEIQTLLETISEMDIESSTPASTEKGNERQLIQEDLHLVCWEYVWS